MHLSHEAETPPIAYTMAKASLAADTGVAPVQLLGRTYLGDRTVISARRGTVVLSSSESARAAMRAIKELVSAHHGQRENAA